MLVIFLVFVNLIGREGIASDGEITLKEAIDIGLQRAKEWNVNATLTSVNSVDETNGRLERRNRETLYMDYDLYRSRYR